MGRDEREFVCAKMLRGFGYLDGYSIPKLENTTHYGA